MSCFQYRNLSVKVNCVTRGDVKKLRYFTARLTIRVHQDSIAVSLFVYDLAEFDKYSVSDNKIQISILILRRGALSLEVHPPYGLGDVISSFHQLWKLCSTMLAGNIWREERKNRFVEIFSHQDTTHDLFSGSVLPMIHVIDQVIYLMGCMSFSCCVKVNLSLGA